MKLVMKRVIKMCNNTYLKQVRSKRVKLQTCEFIKGFLALLRTVGSVSKDEPSTVLKLSVF